MKRHAKIVKILKASKDRIDPKCEHFLKCGGCDLQHMDNTMQNNFKRQKIVDNLNSFRL